MSDLKTARTYGKIWLHGDSWRMELEPHVVMWAKRIFKKIPTGGQGIHKLSNTPEVCRDLEWFMQRFPLEIAGGNGSAAALANGAKSHREHIATLDQLVDPNYTPRSFGLAIPARDYQRRAAELFLAQRNLLLADDVGLGKSAEAICAFTEGRTLPAVVVCLAHLPKQWLREINRFAPDLFVHVIKKSEPYELPKFMGRSPDVLLVSYYKLHGWADVLSRYANSVTFDECQELRRSGTDKYQACEHLASKMRYRLGMSVGPNSTIELFGGPFGSGWSGRIEDAYVIVSACIRSTPMLGYDVLPAEHLGIHSRGLVGERFAWKPVRCFIRHGCDKPVRTIVAGGRNLLVTDDHAVYVARSAALVPVRGDHLVAGDIVPADDGFGWELGAPVEVPIDTVEVARIVRRAQVTVELSGVTRQQLGLKAWEWQNCHREATYGTRLPVEVFIRHRHLLPAPTMVYVGRGKAASIAPSVILSEWAYVLGFFLGDGWVENRQRVSFAVDVPNIEKLIAALRALPMRLRPKIQRTHGASVEVRCTHRLFAEVLTHIGISKGCFDKAIPGEWLVSWSVAARRSLLQGLLDSDGHELKNDSRNRSPDNYTTTSPALAASVRALLCSLGTHAGTHTRPPCRGGTIRGRVIQGKHPAHLVYWSRNALNGRNDGHRGHRRSLKWSEGKFNEAHVLRNVIATAPVYVYDLEMEGHPSFVAEGLLVHNSATPIYNYGGEIYSVLNVINPGCLGTHDEFLREWCTGYHGKERLKDPAAFGSWMKEQHIMLRRTRKDVNRELPPLSRVTHEIDSDTAALKEIAGRAGELARLILSEEKMSRGAKMHAAEDFSMIMRQATGIAKAPYVAAFVEMLLDNGEPVVLYGWHRACYEIWKEKLAEHKPAMYTGSESPTQKQNEVDRFLKGDTDLLMVSLRSGAGVDGLQKRCRTTVHGELDWSAGVLEQNIGRVFRDGQTDPVTAYFLISDSGSDPLMAEVLGLKREQLDGIRNDSPGDCLQEVDTGQTIRRLAEQYVGKRS